MCVQMHIFINKCIKYMCINMCVCVQFLQCGCLQQLHSEMHIFLDFRKDFETVPHRILLVHGALEKNWMKG